MNIQKLIDDLNHVKTLMFDGETEEAEDQIDFILQEVVAYKQSQEKRQKKKRKS